MSRFRQCKSRVTHETGFTLVEVMIVVMIIGILSSIATPAILHAARTAKYRQAEYDLEVIGSAIRRLAWDTGKWPGGHAVTWTGDGAELDDLTTPAAGLLSFTNTLFSASKWKGPYIKRIETDPWNTPYFWDEDYETGHGREIGKSGKIVDIVMRTAVGSYGPNKRGKNVYDDDDTYLVIK